MLNAPKIAPTNATIRVNPHGYSSCPFRLFASAFMAIRINPHGYSPWQTTHKKKQKEYYYQYFYG